MPLITKKIITSNYSGRGGVKIIQYTPHTCVCNTDSLYSYFNNPNTKASTHFFVNCKGAIEQYVEESNMAWANSNLQANRQSITCEHCDGGDANNSVRTPELYESAAQLMAYICKKYNIPLKLLTQAEALANVPGITLHKYYANKSCPGALNVQKIIDRALIINNPTPMVSDQRLVHDYNNLLGHVLSPTQQANEIAAYHNPAIYNNDYGKAIVGFGNNAECLAYNVNDLQTQITALTNANNELKTKIIELSKTIDDQAKVIADQMDTIKELERSNDMKQNQINNLQAQLTECQAGQAGGTVINILGFKIIIIRKK